MNFVGVDGQIHIITTNPRKYPLRLSASKLHLEAMAKVEQEFGNYDILHEFPVAGSKMRFDMFLPQINVAVEAQGEQHDKYVKHFHRNRKKFAQARMRDEKKKSFCIRNQISLYHYMTDGTFKQVV